MNGISLLTPADVSMNYKQLSDITMHDLGLDRICNELSDKAIERDIIKRFMSNLTDNPRVTRYRCDIFEDLMNYPDMRVRMMELLEEIDFIKSYGTFKPGYEEGAGAWDLMHRLGEIRDYIKCIESVYACLDGIDLKSEGLLKLKEYVSDLFEDSGFEELKRDIEALRADTSSIRSVTLGVNLNDRFEAESVGVISVNSRSFSKAGIISNLSNRLGQKDNIRDSEEWDGDMKYNQVSSSDLGYFDALDKLTKFNIAYTHPIMAASMAGVPQGDKAEGTMQYMDKLMNHLISLSVKRLRDILRKYVGISLRDISNLIPEFVYYIRWAEYVEALQKKGVQFVKPEVYSDDCQDRRMKARGIYNLKLLELIRDKEALPDIVTNDLDFNYEHMVYILTGANRGGKTTITQAIGQLFVLAQGGIYIPGQEFCFDPVDGIFTHFPADEDKTLDLGRLGEECQRFKELYTASSRTSLLLLNETFSTTSFEEGYYIAMDAVKAILGKGVRTIYNTHMHKLAYEIAEINSGDIDGRAASLVVRADEGQRTYKVEVAPPEGISYARDIAKKYGVTFEQLCEKESL